MDKHSRLTRRRFLRSTAVAAGGLALASRAGFAAAPVPGVPDAVLKRLAVGANVCRWFRFPRPESAEHFSHYIPMAEAEFMAEIGLKHVRLCVAPKVIMDQDTGAVRADRIGFLEGAIKRFQRAGLLVVVDIHNEDRAAELNPEWQNAFVKFWGELASRLSSFDPGWTVLEIINEPVFARREGEWNTLNARLASAIRQSAPEHTIITSGPDWGGIDGLKKLMPLADRNVVCSFHCYDPFPFTHQGATWSSDAVKPLRGVPYPSNPDAVAPLLPALKGHSDSRALIENYGRERWDKARLAARFSEGIAWGEKHGLPLYCGEFGVYPVYSKPEDRAAWFRDFGEVLAENKIGWAVWGWDEGFGLNRKYVDGKPVVDAVVARALGLKVG